MNMMIKTILATFILSSFGIANANVVHVWQCKLHDGKTEADAMKVSSAWLATHKSMKGGSEIKVYHEFPLVANVVDGSFNWVMIAPNAETWGAFEGGSHSTAASEADNAWNEVASCNGSTLWNSVKVE
jgi:hypothetical protein